MERNELPKLLYKNIDMVKPYPNTVKPVDKMVDITAFFPGGKGLWLEEYSEVFPSVLVLGQDFSTVKQYKRILRNEATDLECATWRNLIKFFNEAGIDLKDCFFSNVFMGLRDTVSMTGEFPGSKDEDFVKRNIDFLYYQIDVIKPKVIITLGIPSSEFLAKLSSDLDCWTDGKALRVPNIGLQKNVRFKDNVCTCLALEHTSCRNANVKRRKYINNSGDHCGNDAEVEMLRDVKIINSQSS
ncbi:MAG: uracil-DNA glycosylase family protein [Clostridium sp.]|uniref:uracil-DNA glycosylase family protein n=1 Tax=Clostridium sp. TaxID=1506 RepID=UPI003D6D3049